MQQEFNLNVFATERISKLIIRFSLPAIAGMIVESLYNIIDRYFVGQGVGYLGIAGITLCFPLVLFISALSMIIGVGSNTLFAIRLGEQKYDQARLILNNAFMLLIVMAVLTFIGGEVFMEPLLRSFGASDETLPYATSYMRILLCGSIFQTITPGMLHFIRSMGHPKTAMFRSMTGAVLNTIFDWIFIIKLEWGIQGAAWATVLSQFLTTILVLSFFFKKQNPIRLGTRYMKLKLPYVRKIFILGIPPSVMQVCNSLMNVVLNNSLAYYGAKSSYQSGDLAISAFGIINSLAAILVLPLLGFVQGVSPVIGYNFGAQQFLRMRRLVKLTLIYGVVFTCLAWLLIQFFAENFATPFAPDSPALVELASKGMRLYLFALPMVAIGCLCGNFFQGTGKAGRAMLLNLNRQVIFLIPLLLILPRFIGLKGVFMAAPISDTVAAVVGVLVLALELRRTPKIDKAITLRGGKT